MRPKNVTLCPTTYEIARTIPNFSEWVRMKLFHHNKENKVHKESRIMFHRECGSDVPAEWKQFTDGTYAWFGFCEKCHTDVVWRPRQ